MLSYFGVCAVSTGPRSCRQRPSSSGMASSSESGRWRRLQRRHFISGEGKTLLPGLIDGHTHTFSAEHLRQAVVFGVTTELDMFTDAGFAARMKSEQAAGNANDRADLHSCGTLATVTWRNGTGFTAEDPDDHQARRGRHVRRSPNHRRLRLYQDHL